MDLKSKIQKINDTIALKATLLIGTMWCVYSFIIFALIPLFLPATNTIIQYVSSAFLQLIFLPLIMVGQDVMSRKAEERAQQDHEMIMAEFEEIKRMHKELHAIAVAQHVATGDDAEEHF